ncbi:MAG: cardiolipin synthase [Halobacteriovoraceae bacterium]|nr:cardiolipin synthase [Halobacteriovoraceae bacterium]
MSFFLIIFETALVFHVLMNKRDYRGQIAWISIIIFSPIFGALAYIVFGINRIKSTGLRLVSDMTEPEKIEELIQSNKIIESSCPQQFSQHLTLGNNSHHFSFCHGNKIETFHEGKVAYESMIEEIDMANHNIYLCTYIFDYDELGERFVNSLAKAKERGVEVKVLVDGAGTKYSSPSIIKVLKKNKIPFAIFLPVRHPFNVRYMNLRNHRKIMVIDGHHAFTGGMNIRRGHLDKIDDLHFKLQGPVVQQIYEIFVKDWNFSVQKKRRLVKKKLNLHSSGEILCRSIIDGPSEYIDKLPLTLESIIRCAKYEIWLQTPYFVPERDLVTSLKVAALSGVKINILLPRHNNFSFMTWATETIIPELIDAGCNIYYVGDKFEHSKLMVVDGCWSLIGSTNWDVRSLRLNFEFNIECLNQNFALELTSILENKLKTSTQLSSEVFQNRPTFYKLRSNLCRLFTPYL